MNSPLSQSRTEKRYPLRSVTFNDGTVSVIALMRQASLVPDAIYPHGLGSTDGSLYYTEPEVKARPALLKLCGEPVEVALSEPN